MYEYSDIYHTDFSSKVFTKADYIYSVTETIYDCGGCDLAVKYLGGLGPVTYPTHVSGALPTTLTAFACSEST